MEPSISRRELSRRLCEEHDWRSANGQLKDVSCRKALAELDRQGVIALPSIETTYAFERTAEPMAIDVPELRCPLSELGQITVRPVSSRYAKESRIWRSLLDCYHYLGSGPLCGAQLRYLVQSEFYGPIGALAFTSASWALAARDQYIGWTEAARRANLSRVVCNARFLIAPSVQVANLASHVLGLALKRLPDDWEQRYGERPVLVETFVNPRHFLGTCYRAANWVYIGDTAGRRDGVPKRILVRQLCADWQRILCQAPRVQLGEMPRPEDPANWAEAEFGTVRLYDGRLRERLYTLAQDFCNRSEATIPEACGSKARTMAAYRFFQNRKVTMDVLLTPHTESTIERIREHHVVLAPQDTTLLDYSTHRMTQGLGPIGDGRGLGLILHDTMAFTEDGTPLGVLDAQCWARNPSKGPRKKPLPIEQKESMKWLRSYRKLSEIQRLCPDTMLVSIGDREADIYELLREATRDPAGPKLLVRAERTRQRKVADEYLWEHMAACDVAGMLKLHLPRRGSRKARDTWLQLRFDRVEVIPPKHHALDPPISLWAVYLLEDTDDEHVKPIEWMLLTTAPVENLKDAKQRVQWYSARWGIEVYHRTLKSGCRIQDRQLASSDRLEACLGLDMVVAWRIYHLTMLGRETPDVSCTAFFSEVEWKALCCYSTKNPLPPKDPPTLSEAIRMLGKIGGHLGRKSDGPPGTQVLWKGLQRLDTATEMYAIFTEPDQRPP